MESWTAGKVKRLLGRKGSAGDLESQEQAPCAKLISDFSEFENEGSADADRRSV